MHVHPLAGGDEEVKRENAGALEFYEEGRQLKASTSSFPLFLNLFHITFFSL